MSTPAYTDIDRDLVALIAKRVGDAMTSVMQLAEDDRQAFVLATAGLAIAMGVAAGAYAVRQKVDAASVDHIALAEAILVRMREERAVGK